MTAASKRAGRRPLVGRAYGPRTSPECAAVRHGNAAAYSTHRCRCPEAREDWRLYNKRRRERRHRRAVTDATGTCRRLQALATLGWAAPLLAARLGVDPAGITRLYHAERVNTATADAVARLYTQLSDTPGPSVVGRRRAARRGWAPPIAWDDDTIDDPGASPAHHGQPHGDHDDVDEVAVDRVLAGHRLRLTRAERTAVAAAVLARGGGASALARLLGCSGAAAGELLARAGAGRRGGWAA